MSGAPEIVRAAINSLPPVSPPATVTRKPLSAAIIELIKPYEHEATDLRMYTVLVKLAALAWNLASLPEAEREGPIGEAADRMETLDGVAVRKVILTLSRRKNSLFPHDRRLVLGSEVTMKPNGYHVMVTSARTA
jgi:hypothetical protein